MNCPSVRSSFIHRSIILTHQLSRHVNRRTPVTSPRWRHRRRVTWSYRSDKCRRDAYSRFVDKRIALCLFLFHARKFCWTASVMYSGLPLTSTSLVLLLLLLPLLLGLLSPLIDWLIEHGLTSPCQHSVGYKETFLQVKRPNQQYQSTEGTQTVGHK